LANRDREYREMVAEVRSRLNRIKPSRTPASDDVDMTSQLRSSLRHMVSLSSRSTPFDMFVIMSTRVSAFTFTFQVLLSLSDLNRRKIIKLRRRSTLEIPLLYLYRVRKFSHKPTPSCAILFTS